MKLSFLHLIQENVTSLKIEVKMALIRCLMSDILIIYPKKKNTAYLRDEKNNF